MSAYILQYVKCLLHRQGTFEAHIQSQPARIATFHIFPESPFEGLEILERRRDAWSCYQLL